VSLPAVLLIASAAGLLAARRRWRWAAGTAFTLAQPVLAIGGGLAAGMLLGRRRLRARRRRSEDAAADVAVLAEMVGLALSAGLTLSQALRAAGPLIHPSLQREVATVLRRATRSGLGNALSAATGHGRRFFVLVARAVVTGAPLAPAVDSFVREAAAERRAVRLEDARRLPVRLMLPLALLILPGFVLLTVGPTVLAALERFAL
jgi:tight adherence protein C